MWGPGTNMVVENIWKVHKIVTMSTGHITQKSYEYYIILRYFFRRTNVTKKIYYGHWLDMAIWSTPQSFYFHDLQKKFEVKRLCWQGLFITEMSFHYCWIRRQGYKCVPPSLCCPTFDGFPLISWSSILSSSLSTFSWHHFLWNITETEWLGKKQSKNGRVTYNLGTLGSICSKNKV